jgi:CsoR family transcriptional regulator, copper-sensing transcriptional repressor
MDSCDPKAIYNQAKRTEGQVVSIARMLSEQRTCSEVLQQIVAARASLSKLGQMMLQAEAEGCLGQAVGELRVKDLERTVQNLFKIS